MDRTEAVLSLIGDLYAQANAAQAALAVVTAERDVLAARVAELEAMPIPDEFPVEP